MRKSTTRTSMRKSTTRTSMRKSTTRTRARWAEAPPSPFREGLRRGRLCNLGRGSAGSDAGIALSYGLREADRASASARGVKSRQGRTRRSREPGLDETGGTCGDGDQSAPGGASLYADPEVAVLLRLAPSGRAEVQLLPPHVPPPPLRRSGRGVLAAIERGHTLGRRRRAAGGNHRPRRVHAREHARPA